MEPNGAKPGFGHDCRRFRDAEKRAKAFAHVTPWLRDRDVNPETNETRSVENFRGRAQCSGDYAKRLCSSRCHRWSPKTRVCRGNFLKETLGRHNEHQRRPRLQGRLEPTAEQGAVAPQPSAQASVTKQPRECCSVISGSDFQYSLKIKIKQRSKELVQIPQAIGGVIVLTFGCAPRRSAILACRTKHPWACPCVIAQTIAPTAWVQPTPVRQRPWTWHRQKL